MPEEDEEAQQKLVLLSLYLLLLRRKNGRGKPKQEALQRVQEAQRRSLLRHYHLVRQKRLLLLLMARRWQHGSTSELSSLSNHDWWENVALKEFGPQDWLENFRMSKDTFLHVCDQLRPKLCRRQKTRLTPEKKLAVALWQLASNTKCHVVSSLFGVRPLMVVRCAREVCQAIISVLKPLYLHLPNDHEMENMARIFSTHWGFPRCIGALGTLHVGVVAPTDCSNNYQNSQQWNSMVLQAAVDGFGQFWDICAGFPGGMDNNDILQNSYLWILARESGFLSKLPGQFSGKTLKYVLLGDTSLPLQDWLIKPYVHSERLTQPQILFNHNLERAHAVLEKAFLRLRARWQCLLWQHNLTLVTPMVMACCILHNVCEMHASPFKTSWFKAVEMSQFTQPHHPLSISLDDSVAEEVRSGFCSYFQNPQYN